MRLLLLLLLFPNLAYSSTLIVQTHAVTVEYGDKTAQVVPNSRLVMLRDFSLDHNDNLQDVMALATRRSSEYDNLVILGYKGIILHDNVKVVPLYADLSVYTETLARVIDAFNRTAKGKVHVFCNSGAHYCPTSLGTIHTIRTTIQLRTELSKLDRNDIVVDLMDSVFHEDTQSLEYGSDLVMWFKKFHVLDIGILRQGHAINLTVSPEAIMSGDANAADVSVSLSRLLYLGRSRDFLRASEQITLRAEQ